MQDGRNPSLASGSHYLSRDPGRRLRCLTSGGRRRVSLLVETWFSSSRDEVATTRQWGVKSQDLKPSEKSGERQRAWLVTSQRHGTKETSYCVVSVLSIQVPLTYSSLASFKDTSEPPVQKSPLNGMLEPCSHAFPLNSQFTSVDHVWINGSGYASERGS